MAGVRRRRKVQERKRSATAVGRDRSYCASLLRLAMLSPEIIHKVIQGEASAMMTVEFLRSRLPVLWDDQMPLLFK